MTPLPAVRPRRLRRTPGLRALTREVSLSPAQLIFPMFVHEGEGDSEISTMPGVLRHCLASAVERAREAQALGVRSVILFGIPDEKDEVAGHWSVDNDPTLDLLARTAVSQARAGADIVAPSAMMDGQVAAIRAGLDAAGFGHVPIMSYAVKYASAYYGPFREAAGSAPSVGDRASYQMDPAGGLREALREARLDVEEGADFLMVKPALAYLDVLRAVREEFDLPLVAYNVSGEYSLVKAAAQLGYMDERRTVLETLTGMRRAGADAIITYHALDAARWLAGGV